MIMSLPCAFMCYLLENFAWTIYLVYYLEIKLTTILVNNFTKTMSKILSVFPK